MLNTNWMIVLHFLLLWGSVLASIVAGWHLPLSYTVAVPLGLLLWAAGFLYNLYTLRRFRDEPPMHRSALARRGYLRIAARTLMNLGVAFAFLSWLTLIAAAILLPIYAAVARSRRRHLDYLRSGMLSDAFPDRTRKK